MTSPRLKAVLALAALASACGSGSVKGITDHPDAGTSGSVDAGPSDSPDAGAAPSSITITPNVAHDPRRGPIALSFTVSDPKGEADGYLLEVGSSGDWSRATLVDTDRSENELVYVWNSFADAPVDDTIPLRLTALKSGTPVVSQPFSMQVRNKPDTNRVVLVGHNLGDDGTESGHAVSAFVWDATTPQVDGAEVRVNVGVGPAAMRAAPHGRATAVLEETDETVSLVLTPLDATLDHVTRMGPFKLPYGLPMALAWSTDGRFLYVLGSTSDDQTKPAALWKFAPAEDLSAMGDASLVTTLPGPPMALDLDRVHERLLVYCGSGGSGKDKLILLDAAGHELARLEDDIDAPQGMTVSPAGDSAFLTSVFGAGVQRFALTDTSITKQGDPLAIDSAQEVIFHPASTADAGVALVSMLEKNRVTAVKLSPTQSLPGTPVAGFPLSAEMDRIERGSQIGTILIPGVSPSSDHSLVQQTVLSLDGTVTAGTTALDLGTQTADIPEGISIQR